MNWGNPERGKVLLLAGDFALAAAAVGLGMLLHAAAPAVWLGRAALISTFTLVYTTCFYIFDLYDLQALNGLATLTRLVAASFAGTCVLNLLMTLLRWTSFGPRALTVSVLTLIVTGFLWRRLYKTHRGSLFAKRRVLMIGTAEDAANLRAILESKQSLYELCGFLQTEVSAETSEVGVAIGTRAPLVAAAAAGATYQSYGGVTLEPAPRFPAVLMSERSDTGARNLGVLTQTNLQQLAARYAVDTIVTSDTSAVSDFADSLTRLRFEGVRIATMPDLSSEVLEELPLDTLSDTWLSFATGFHLLHGQLFRKIKRVSDLFLACAGLLATLPVSIIVAIAIKLESPGPVLFRQWRVGRMEKPFVLFKFRSMRLDAESEGSPQWASVGDPRVTRVGRVLRGLHIDEIPQMINVLLGEMSFVGPRPERPLFVEQLKQIIPFYSLRHHLPPGITGWAQVNYPYGASVEDARRKLQYDLFYVRNASATMDLRILLRTFRVILFRLGNR